MDILSQLSSSQGKRDESANVELAKKIIAKNDKAAVKTLVENLTHKNNRIKGDCIKALYETGYVKPELIALYWKEFSKALESKHNRLVWGAMTALDCIAGVDAKNIHSVLDKVLTAADSGSVITRDHAVAILVKLAAHKKYNEECIVLLMEQIAEAPMNQWPTYAEKTAEVIGEKQKPQFIKLLNARLKETDQESKRKRMEKVLKKVTNK